MEKRAMLLLNSLPTITLTKKMRDDEIIDEFLGGVRGLSKHLFTTRKIESILRCKALRDKGVLLVDGSVNLFYYLCKTEKDIASHCACFVREEKTEVIQGRGGPCRVSWPHYSWKEERWSTEHPRTYQAGSRVFLRQ